jgi:uncharacterized RDD family membrane protein YckC
VLTPFPLIGDLEVADISVIAGTFSGSRWAVITPVFSGDVDEFDIIETPENVDLQRRLAGIGSRFVAGLLDALLIVGTLFIVALLTLFFSAGLFAFSADLTRGADKWVLAVFLVLLFLIYWGYFVLFETWMNGQTPGKKYMHIRVVQEEGGGVSFQAVAIRNLLRAVDFIGLYAVAGIAMFLTKKAQRLGDLAAGTVVISEEVPDYAAQADKKAQVLDEAAVEAAALEATALKPQEYRLLRNYWLRRDQLSLKARADLLPKLLGPILERLGTPLTDGTLGTLERRLEELLRQAQAADGDRGRPDAAGKERI